MLKVLSTGVILGIILTTVYSNENLTKELPKLYKSVLKKLSNLRQNRTTEVSNLSQNITAKVSNLRQNISTEVRNLSKNITAKVSNLRQNISTEVRNLSQNITAKVSNLRQNISTEVRNLSQNITAKVSNLRQNIATEVSNSSQNITTDVSNLSKNITERDSNRSITIEEAISKDDIIINGDMVAVRLRSYFDPETDQVWKLYLSEQMRHFKEKIRTTTAMRNNAAVTKSYSSSKRQEILKQNNNQRDTGSDSIISNNYVNYIIVKVKTLLNRNVNSLNATGQKVSRRQKLTKQGKLLQKMQEFSGFNKLKFERYREPYWKEGDYVFLRTGSPVTARNESEVWKFGQVTSTMNPMEIFRDCDRVCSHYFKAYGKVCGHRLKSRGWENEYKNFDNICDMDHDNCVDPTKRPHWHPLYKGVCGELEEFKQAPIEETWVIRDVKTWDPYVYVPPEPTDPTADPLDEELKKALLETQVDATKAAG